jgi:hypothetical protein
MHMQRERSRGNRLRQAALSLKEKWLYSQEVSRDAGVSGTYAYRPDSTTSAARGRY